MPQEREFRLQMTVRDRDLQTIFDLLHDVARDFKMIELQHGKPNGTDVPVETPRDYESYKKEHSGRWATRLWPELEPLFRQQKERGDGMIRFDDPRFKEILTKTGNSPSTITPLLSELRRMGKLVRPHRGWYMLP